MKALGTVPEKLYKFYLIETFLIFLFGFALGLLASLLGYYIFIEILKMFNIAIYFEFNLFFTALLFILGTIGCLLTAGWILRKIGKQNVMHSFSKEIPHNYTPKSLTFIPKWLSSLGKNIKHSVMNSIREKGRYKRYIIIFVVMGLVMFTISLGAFVLDNTSRSWINKSQAPQKANIIAIGHRDVVHNYSDMYEMYSNPNIFIEDADIQFTNQQYLFNFSQVQSIQNLNGVEQIDQRLMRFCHIQELQSYVIDEDGNYRTIGQTREAKLPVMGINTSSLIPDFEFLRGKFFSQENASSMITISDGIANNLFENPMVQEAALTDFGSTFHISGVVFDAYYSGFASYIDLNEFKTLLGTNGINMLLLRLSSKNLKNNLEQISTIINENLGKEYTYISLKQSFQKNLTFVNILTTFNGILLISTSIISLFSIYQFQKGELTEKLRDFFIMHALGSKIKNIKRILFFQGIFVIIPALSISLAGGLILNLFFLFDRTIIDMPSIIIPLSIFGILLTIFILLNYLVVSPLSKKIERSSLVSMKRT
jgi:ABC-type antimicrobial peptide transport system permease subunit